VDIGLGLLKKMTFAKEIAVMQYYTAL